MKQEYERNRIAYYTYFPLVFGIVVGGILFYILLLSNGTYFLEDGLSDYKLDAVLNISVIDLIIYVLKKRFGQSLLFLIILVVCSYRIAACTYNFLFGFYYGIVVCNQLVKFGMSGMIYGIVCFLPHYLIYFLAIYLLGKWFYMDSKQKIYQYMNGNKLQYIVQYVVIFFLIIIALIWEIKFQKNILQYFYQYLV